MKGIVAALRQSRVAVAASLCGPLLPHGGYELRADAVPRLADTRHCAPGTRWNRDLLTRMLGEQLGRALGVAVVVENKPGASGIIGNEIAMRAASDGYTLLAASTATHAMAPHVVAILPYDPVADFVPVINLVYQTKVVLVNASLVPRRCARWWRSRGAGLARSTTHQPASDRLATSTRSSSLR